MAHEPGSAEVGSPCSSSGHSEQCYCRDCTKYGPPDPNMRKLTKRLAQEWLAEADSVPKERGIKALKENLLPFSRVRRIMKANQDVKMISAETPFLLTKAARYLIQELTSKSWIATTSNSRRTLLQEDIKHSILKTEKFDFLVDVIDGTLEMEKQLGKYQPRSKPVTDTEASNAQCQQQMQVPRQPQHQTDAPTGYSYAAQQGTWSSSAHDATYANSSAYMPNAQYVIYQPRPVAHQFQAEQLNNTRPEVHGYNRHPERSQSYQPE